MDRFSNPKKKGVSRNMKEISKDSFLSLLDKVKGFGIKANIMEVCGSHTHTIIKTGLYKLLDGTINFVHGPGCPVCVIPSSKIDTAIEIANQKGVILCAYGDVMRVPGEKGSLITARAKGADVRMVYSPMEVIKIAKENKEKVVVFFAIGFETTIPMTAGLIESVLKDEIKNVVFYIVHFLVPPVLEALLEEKPKIDGFIAPGHVSAIIGEKPYIPIAKKYHKPFVIAGFEGIDVLFAVYKILLQLKEKKAFVENIYKSVVKEEGNKIAKEKIKKYFEEVSGFWRGLGEIPKSALALKKDFKHLSAEERLGIKIEIKDYIKKGCICDLIVQGKKKPSECPSFGKACTPEHPLGACMVSSEGACAAYYLSGFLM